MPKLKDDKKQIPQEPSKYTIRKRTPQQVGRYSKTKGDKFERYVANLLSNKFEKELKQKGGEFRRSPQSGGWSKRLKHTFGDLIVPDWFSLFVSCKSTKTINLTGVLTGDGGDKQKLDVFLQEMCLMDFHVEDRYHGGILFLKVNKNGMLCGVKNTLAYETMDSIYIEIVGNGFGNFAIINDFIFFPESTFLHLRNNIFILK